MAHIATNRPRNDVPAPNTDANAPTGPRRMRRPNPNSTMSRGIDHVKRKMAHGMRNVPPPLAAMTRGKRQMFPVPIAIPRAAKISPSEDENCSELGVSAPVLGAMVDDVSEDSTMETSVISPGSPRLYARFWCEPRMSAVPLKFGESSPLWTRHGFRPVLFTGSQSTNDGVDFLQIDRFPFRSEKAFGNFVASPVVIRGRWAVMDVAVAEGGDESVLVG